MSVAKVLEERIPTCIAVFSQKEFKGAIIFQECHEAWLLLHVRGVVSFREILGASEITDRGPEP
jgi:hypothetical protein